MWCPTRINIRTVIILIYANELNRASDILSPIMSACDTNLIYSHKDIKMLFQTVKTELVKINHWFKAKKLSLNAKKLIIPFFTNLQLRKIYL